MYLRVHRLSDAVSGALLGIGASPVCLAVARLG
jgi:hypothetical protein